MTDRHGGDVHGAVRRCAAVGTQVMRKSKIAACLLGHQRQRAALQAVVLARAERPGRQHIPALHAPDGNHRLRASDSEHGRNQVQRDRFAGRQRVRRHLRGPAAVFLTDTSLGTHAHLEAAQEIKVLRLDSDDGDFRPDAGLPALYVAAVAERALKAARNADCASVVGNPERVLKRAASPGGNACGRPK